MIPLFKVRMPSSVGAAVLDTLYSGLVTEGPKAALFEKIFQGWLGNRNTAIVNSGTSALTLALRMCGAGLDTEIISTPMTCMAANTAAAAMGARIIWADIDPGTGCIDVESARSMITAKTKAIMFVDWAGIPANLDGLASIALDYGVKLIEDAAHSIGARYKGRKIGNLCDYVCFSFQAIKHLTTVDGGAIACADVASYERARWLRWYGLDRHAPRTALWWGGDASEAGYKMHMNDVLATIGIEQIKDLDTTIEQHRRNANWLIDAFVETRGISTPRIDIGIEPSFWVLPLRFSSPELRQHVSDSLTAAGIQNSIVHRRNDSYKMFSKSKRQLPGVDIYAGTMLCVPCGWWISEIEREDIARTVVDAVRGLCEVLVGTRSGREAILSGPRPNCREDIWILHVGGAV